MNDLISRQDAIDALNKKRIETMEKGQDVDPIWECLDVVVQAPSAQPERNKGEWIPLQLSTDNTYYQCSCCRRNAPMVEAGCLMNRHLEALLTDFCPNCGADMRGE